MGLRSIVIIDDSEIDLELLALIIADIPNTEVQKFQSSIEALKYLSTVPTPIVDLILCDFEMPNLNGLETLIAYRNMNEHTPFLFITAHATIERAKECRKEGATGFILKPYVSHDLLDKIEGILDQT